MKISEELLNFVIENIDKEELLKKALENGHTETVKFLLDRGANTHADNDSLLCFPLMSWKNFFGNMEKKENIKPLLKK